jgi:hypothetical protein
MAMGLRGKGRVLSTLLLVVLIVVVQFQGGRVAEIAEARAVLNTSKRVAAHMAVQVRHAATYNRMKLQSYKINEAINRLRSLHFPGNHP